MSGFHNLKELANTLSWSKDLLSEMFEKRKSFSYKYEHAINLLEEPKIETLINKGVLRQNGPYLEIDEQFLEFFERILEVNEEINTSYVNESIQQIKYNINYYLQENNDNRRYSYLKAVKSSLRKMGRIILRNIIDLNRNIENAYKAEPSYKIKISKLETFDEKRKIIHALILQAELLITEEEKTFFITALDSELSQLVSMLRMQLTEARHNLIETQQQIITYLNQVKHQSRVIEKIKQLKYLKDQFELNPKSNITAILSQQNAVVFEPRTSYSFKLSLDQLQTDEGRSIIKKVADKLKVNKKALPVAEAIAKDYLNTNSEEEVYINLEELRRGFIASGYHLFDFVLQYRFPREVKLEERVTIYCQLLGMYEKDVDVTEEFEQHEQVEFAIVKQVK